MGLYNVNPRVYLSKIRGYVVNIISQFLEKALMAFDSFVKVRQHSGKHYAIFFRGIYIKMS